MSTSPRPRSRSLGILTAVLTAIGLVFGGLALAQPALADTAPPDPTNPASPPTVGADVLPTTQIDGVAWAQVVVGNTVYVAGKFTTARPAGAAAGTNTTPRSNLLAYDITTGNLITGFNVPLNAQALAITASPDGSRIYVGGDFTTAGSGNYYRIVAISTATGQVISSFRPIMESEVRALAATNTAVYAGGTFSSVNGTPTGYIAKINASDGSLNTTWAASADYVVDALAVSPDTTKVYAGGRFQNANGSNPAYGLAMFDGTTGAFQTFGANSVVRDAGDQAGITSLVATSDRVYGSGYVFGTGGNLEGSFSADPSTGNLIWMEDCHGDTYSVWPMNNALYVAGHPHYCGNVGGFPQTNPWTYHHTIAFSKAQTGTLTNNGDGAYANFTGEPSPTLLNWFPQYVTGSFTGQGQAAWTVAGNGNYLVAGGEFPYVNGVAQYGLVRYAMDNVVKSKLGPNVNTSLVPNAVSFKTGQARVSWTATYDQDNVNLSYKVVRDGNNASPVYQTTLISNFWTRPSMGFVDTGLAPGSTHSYRVYVTDPDGNQISRLGNTVTIASTDSGGPYADSVTNAGASSYWPLDEASGAIGYDHVGFSDLQLQAGATRNGVAGPISGSTATTFSGASTGFAVTPSSITGPNTFTVSAWFNTTSTSGGKIIGFGNSNTSTTSSSYDRHVYMDNNGRIWFGVYPGGVQTLNSGTGYNDGQWHQVTASLGANGMRLYLDGKQVGSRTDVTSAQSYSGYWRVGGDNLGGWPNRPSSDFFAGTIGQVSLYPTVLDRTTVVNQYVASGRPSPLQAAPSDAYGAAVYNANPDIYWRLDETSGSTAFSADAYSNNGTYSGTATTKGQQGVLSATDKAVKFNTPLHGSGGSLVSSNQQFTNPTVYTEEIWFKTSTTQGGKLIGFGDQQTGLSNSYDRHIYMQNDGRLVFGVWTGQTNTITSPTALNNNQWHQVVGVQGPDGMSLYVDGQLVGTNPQTAAQAYNGYWRIGGDNTWGSTSAYFNGTLDEAAIYPSELTAQQVANHYSLATTGTLPNQTPTASFTTTQNSLTVNVDGTASNDPDGTIASYAWDFGDGATASTATASHTYAAGGTYTVALTVTDNQGSTNTASKQVTVVANQPPVASFTSSVSNLTASFDASASSDPDGTVASYAWDFGDGTTGTGVNPTHTYGSAGTFTVTLTVTDNQGLAGTPAQNPVTTTLPPNQPPVASFTASTNGLTVSVDGTGSSDPDGTIAGYAWDFGDGATATTATASHAYASGGTYTVTLTVTDNRGGTNAATKPVTVTAPPPAAIASDTFERTSASGWGSADLGGAWTGAGSATAYSVGGGTGQIVGAAGSTKTQLLNTVSSSNTDTTVQFTTDRTSTGGGIFVSALGRVVGTSEYSARVWFQSSNLVQLQLLQGSTALQLVNISGLTYAPGTQYQVRVQVFGTSPTTIRARVWKVGATEPATWQASVTDSTAALQAAGAVGLRAYLSGTATDVPLTTKFDNFVVTPAQ
ncbi:MULTISPECIES: PKD domain-containing protein [unclassified Leifsonia]|uniref:PKD domain-containing protein n=1 Tax=unclassified Leifsonia TaxID=2663824 RepID=UPI0008A7E227|nr:MULTISPECIES: PKD domain-containing protein [unclassified Leifsonia]SEI02395.1 PKD repeat-containing protein [Leifsonia sp. CL154]SFL71231.1 PKD repeat-containing protein [Leifsonia sp. CL147]